MKLKLKWKIIFIIILLIVLMIVSLKLGTVGLKVNEYKVVNSKLSNFYGFKIAHFSDLNYGNGVSEKKLSKLVDMINLTKPDIVVFTGDLINNKSKVNDDLVKMLTSYLSKINCNYEKFYINGEIDNNTSSKILTDSGFIALDDNYEILTNENNNTIFISGLSINKSFNDSVIEKLNLNTYDYTILLTHYPDKVDSILKYNFDLILSGHSLNGQIRLPGIGSIFKRSNSKKYYDTYYKLDKTDLYISNGIGNAKINVRLLNTPSFNLYRLVNE